MHFKLNKQYSKFILLFTSIIFITCGSLIKTSKHHVTVSDGDVIGKRGMVASAHPIASEVGINILKQGGNAVDAAVAVALALSIAEPNASGIGGGGFMVIKMANQDKAVMIDYREIAPHKATKQLYYKTESSFKELADEGCTSIGVPGLVAGAELALKHFGSFTLEQALKQAIRLAHEGIIVSEKLNGMITDNYEKISKYPATAEIYLHEMLPIEAGQILKNEDLAQTFKKLAANGAKIFYQGGIASAIVDEVKAQGGIFELEDMKAYRAKIRTPVTGSYRGYQIITAAPPSGGGTHLIELLNIMEGFDIKKLGHNSVEFIHLFAEAMKKIYADKSMNAADPDFFTVPVDSMISKEYARKLRDTINKNKAMFNYSPPHCINMESNSTSHLSVIDEQGNIVALTQSINHWFGSGIVVPGTGILLNDHIKDFDSRKNVPNSVAPHKRPVSSTAPTIILKNGQPFMTVGTPGGSRIISAMAQIIINVIDFQMSMDEAIEAPRVHCLKKVLHVEGRINSDVVEKLKSMGHTVVVHTAYDNYFGGAQGIMINPDTKKLLGGADSRRDGVAVGY